MEFGVDLHVESSEGKAVDLLMESCGSIFGFILGKASFMGN